MPMMLFLILMTAIGLMVLLSARQASAESAVNQPASVDEAVSSDDPLFTAPSPEINIPVE